MLLERYRIREGSGISSTTDSKPRSYISSDPCEREIDSPDSDDVLPIDLDLLILPGESPVLASELLDAGSESDIDSPQPIEIIIELLFESSKSLIHYLELFIDLSFSIAIVIIIPCHR